MASYTLDQKIIREPNLPERVIFEVFDEAPPSTEESKDDYEPFETYSSWDDALKRLLRSAGEVEKSPDGDVLPVLIGVAPLFSEGESKIDYLALATPQRVVVFRSPGEQISANHEKHEALKNLLSGSYVKAKPHLLVGFELASTVLTIFRDFNLPSIGVDIISTFHPKHPNALPSVEVEKRFDTLVGRTFEEIWRPPPKTKEALSTREGQGGEEGDKIPGVQTSASKQVEAVGWRAWMAVVTALTNSPKIHGANPLDSNPREGLTEEHLHRISELQYQWDRMESLQPGMFISEFKGITTEAFGDVVVEQTAFKNKAREGRAQNFILRSKSQDRVLATGRVFKTKGKKTIIKADDGAQLDFENIENNDDLEFQILGRDDMTQAEVARQSFVVKVLQGGKPLEQIGFTRKIWLPSEEDKAELLAVKTDPNVLEPDPENDPVRDTQLNESQKRVARAMLSEASIALVHGPPGTGKTRTISEVVKKWISDGKRSFLVAQTNVGTKNIAEALIKAGVTEFKLLVSNDFFEEWHEKEFEMCKDYMVRSSNFRNFMRKDVKSSLKVILCTMSMLFSPMLDDMGLFIKFELERLVVDEASQIFVGDYLAIFNKFQRTLKKVCWFGDPCQLPPHQREEIEGIQSIYDISHIKEASQLLDTQFRMPPEIGAFISRAVYENDLKSSPAHLIQHRQCVKFVDVRVGMEETAGSSWIGFDQNKREADTLVDLVRNYYATASFSIITPYDSQRKLIEEKMNEAGLTQAQGRCYNVDSFQGNEDHYILISTVRTERTGFLNLQNRINVMLTRAQRGMVIVTNKEMLRVIGRQTLVGQMASHWRAYDDDDDDDGDGAWATYIDVKDTTVDMPGVPGMNRVKKPKAPKPVEVPRLGGFYAPKAPGPTTSSEPGSSKSRRFKPTTTQIMGSGWAVQAPTPVSVSQSSVPKGAWGSNTLPPAPRSQPKGKLGPTITPVYKAPKPAAMPDDAMGWDMSSLPIRTGENDGMEDSPDEEDFQVETPPCYCLTSRSRCE